MENASKALTMAAGILVGVLILALMVTLFASSNEVSTRYEQTKKAEAIQQFNTNFTKYLGQDLTIHQVITMQNFASKLNNKVCEVSVNDMGRTIEDDIKEVNNKYNDYTGQNVKLEIIYRITSIEYNQETGYISEVLIGDRKLKVTEYDENWKFKRTYKENL